jgi:hypothetical protein
VIFSPKNPGAAKNDRTFGTNELSLFFNALQTPKNEHYKITGTLCIFKDLAAIFGPRSKNFRTLPNHVYTRLCKPLTPVKISGKT